MSEAVHNALEIVVEITSELETPRWAVLSFDKVEAGNLNYADALRLLTELDAKGTAGLCIVTDQTAARLAV
jgi:hypothetical protein